MTPKMEVVNLHVASIIALSGGSNVTQTSGDVFNGPITGGNGAARTPRRRNTWHSEW